MRTSQAYKQTLDSDHPRPQSFNGSGLVLAMSYAVNRAFDVSCLDLMKTSKRRTARFQSCDALAALISLAAARAVKTPVRAVGLGLAGVAAGSCKSPVGAL